ncbi:MAG: tRNA U34 2-thiouridine synthase MnmA/TrmU [Dokdonia sp.]|jgi:tRNA U34 2-thiouridine synthase MnmA/TrmU
MGGEGSMMAANQSLKTNRSMMSSRERVRVSLVSNTDEKWVDPKQPTAAQIVAIRIRKRKEQKVEQRKTLVLTIISLIITLGLLVSFIGYVLR